MTFYIKSNNVKTFYITKNSYKYFVIELLFIIALLIF